MNISKIIRKYVDLKGVSWYWLMKNAEIKSNSTIDKMKNGRPIDIKLSTAIKIAKVLDIDMNDFKKSEESKNL
ncbi:helix-turn-helix domain-containing protein [Weissella diestrammenae]|uniref:Helix-turn-helix domain-containing protein n=1 Tax=Weissella diestrammenae TaxID=1162633 RepID=A0A7G9T4N4_9LACO|nr:helix-turn-helix transcriptional regulator [Weissella diestrammenae]MCM0582160.1 helix-turn-helix domain-containing protein [Weissella diestrammenae]QNN75059.1 helix-turn-helix domain-containing protein [Weissella diestrammenae]